MAGRGLKVKFSADTSAFDRGVSKIKGSLAGVGTAALNVAKATAAVGVAAASAAAAFSAWKIKEVIDLGGKLSDMSARTGVAAGELKVMEEALRLAGVEGADMAKVLQTLGKNIANAVGDESGAAAVNLGLLGLKAEELVNMPLSQAFEKVGKAIAGFKTEAQRAAAAQALFGKAGMPLVGLFKDFDSSMTQARSNVGGLAGILDRFASRFDAISDSIAGFNLKIQQFFGGMVSELMPNIENAFNAVGNLDFTQFGQKVGKAIAEAIAGQSEGLRAIGGLIGAYIKAGLEATFGIAVGSIWNTAMDFIDKDWSGKPQKVFPRAPTAAQIGSSSISPESNQDIRDAIDKLTSVIGDFDIRTRTDRKEPLVQY